MIRILYCGSSSACLELDGGAPYYAQGGYAVLVDGVERMADIPRDSILPMPTQNPQKLISGMCSLPDGATMLVLDCSLLLHG